MRPDLSILLVREPAQHASLGRMRAANGHRRR